MHSRLIVFFFVVICLFVSGCGKIITNVAQVVILKEVLKNDTIMNHVNSIKNKLVNLSAYDVQN